MIEAHGNFLVGICLVVVAGSTEGLGTGGIKKLKAGFQDGTLGVWPA
jgi:hypothetical protein